MSEDIEFGAISIKSAPGHDVSLDAICERVVLLCAQHCYLPSQQATDTKFLPANAVSFSDRDQEGDVLICVHKSTDPERKILKKIKAAMENKYGDISCSLMHGEGVKATVEDKLQSFDDDADIVIIELADGYGDPDEDPFKVLKQSVLKFALNHCYSPDGGEPTEEKFMPLQVTNILMHPENHAFYYAMPEGVDPQTFINAVQEDYGQDKDGNALYPFTYIITDGHSAKHKHLEQLEGGLAMDDVTGYEIG